MGAVLRRDDLLKGELLGAWFAADEPFARDFYAGEMDSCFISSEEPSVPQNYERIPIER